MLRFDGAATPVLAFWSPARVVSSSLRTLRSPESPPHAIHPWVVGGVWCGVCGVWWVVNRSYVRRVVWWYGAMAAWMASDEHGDGGSGVDGVGG